MLDDPERTSRLLAALKASLPFEVHLTPPLARLLREQQVVLPAGDRQTVSGVSYLDDEGGIVCHIVPPDGGKVAFVSVPHVRVPPPMPLAAEVLRYQKHRVKKLRQRARPEGPAPGEDGGRVWTSRPRSAPSRARGTTCPGRRCAGRSTAGTRPRPACSGCWSGTPTARTGRRRPRVRSSSSSTSRPSGGRRARSRRCAGC